MKDPVTHLRRPAPPWRPSAPDLDLTECGRPAARYDDGIEWAHASIAHADRMPTYEDLKRLHRAVWGDTGWAVQIFAPKHAHVNIHEHALHLWGRLDGKPFLPDFGVLPDGTRSI